MSDAIETQGTILAISTDGGSPASYTEIKEVVSYNLFDGQASEIDTTHLRSTAKEFLMGLQDFGTGSVDCNYLPDDPGQNMARAAKANRDRHYFKLTQSDGSIASFQGYIISASMSGGVDAKVDTTFNLRVTGDVTFS